MAELDCLLVTSPDRLARNFVHQMVLLEEFRARGCQVDFLDRSISDDPHDQLLLQIQGAVAEYERTLIADRMRRGRLGRAAAAVVYSALRLPGRPGPPAGPGRGEHRPR